MIKVIVVDDENASIQISRRMLSEIADIDVVACFQSALEAKDYLTKNVVDIAILDIEMPEISGFELAHFISFESEINMNCSIVFATAYNKYAVEAFEINALDYLIKPVNRCRFLLTIERIAKNQKILVLPAKIKIRCFDSFKVLIEDKEVSFRTTKAQELIAFLIQKQGKKVTRSEIIDSLWPEFDGDKAVINLNTTLCYAKKALLQYNVSLPVTYDRGSYRIDLSNIDCDYITFLKCNIDEESITSDNIAYYEKLLALYTGNYLASNDYIWAERHRLNLKDKYLHLLVAIARYYEKNNKGNSRIISLMETGFTAAPLDREITYTLIGVLLMEGNYSLAVSYYQTHRQALREALNREPDESLKRLMGFVNAN